jgi:hypothetical protein
VDEINYWGRFDRSWNGGGNDTSRLKDWLDLEGTDTMFIDHYDPNSTSAPEITYRVNTRYIEDFTEVSGVWVFLGDRESWVEMSDEDGDSIYTCTVSHESAAGLNYYFSYGKVSGPDTVFIDERDSLAGTECGLVDGSRTLIVEARNQTLPPVIFGSCLAFPKIPEIKFQVDLSEISNLYPDGAVWVGFGDWQFWKDMTDPDGDGIYTATVPLEAGSNWKYMFGYQTGSDPNANYVDERRRLQGAECADENGYRLLLVTNNNLILPAIVYSTCVESTTSVSDPGDVGKVNIFYNSVNDLVRITNSYDVENIEIFSITGQLLDKIRTSNQESIEINTSALQRGVYIIRIELEANKIQGFKFVK